MTYPKLIIAAIVAAVFVHFSRQSIAAEIAAPAAEFADAQTLLDKWLKALGTSDLASYQQCLHSAARQVPEYGSAEALQFWKGEIGDMGKKGFKGQWKFQKPANVSKRFPAGSLQAIPVINGKALRESDSILLIQEDGQWRIVRLFS